GGRSYKADLLSEETMSQDQYELVSEIFHAHLEVRKAFKEEIISSTQASKAEKKHVDAIGFARNTATKSWAEDRTQTITGLSQYIRDMVEDGGYGAYVQGTVYKWIKDLAPPERHNGGRPKKN
ncbi:MAG: hypothetical protein ABW072_06770, partial [Sedimenticola sp.]